MTDSKEIARNRFNFLDSVAADHRLHPHPHAFRIAYAITGKTRSTGLPRPSQKRLSDELGLDLRTVQTSIDALVASGHLEKIAGRGRGHTTQYKPMVAGKADHGIEPAPAASDFERFWETYPKKIDKGKAHRQFDAVVRARKATPEDLTDAAQRYARERAGQEPRYTKNPANWLLAEAWTNAPEQPAAPSADGARRRPRAASSTNSAGSGGSDGERHHHHRPVRPRRRRQDARGSKTGGHARPTPRLLGPAERPPR
jgi:DNA-binding transcriptional MocR family regulator